MKNILIAVDKFKGSLSSLQAANAIEAGLIETQNDYIIEKIPIADGGEGTVEAIVEKFGGEYISAEVYDPLFRKVNAKYGLIEDGKTAIIEMAAASGITLLNSDELNPLNTTTYGTGELIKDAMERRVNKIIIGIGGSATVDGGVGMASALGYKFLNANGKPVDPVGGQLNNIVAIDSSEADTRLNDIDVISLCDVTNPLIGANGASFVYGPQKGATEQMVLKLDSGLKQLSDIIEKKYNRNYALTPGSGAAGGLGFGLMVFVKAELKNGIDFLIEFLDVEEKVRDADIVITGEGKMDNQTTNNKAPWGIMRLAKKHNKPVFAIAGIIESDAYIHLPKYYDELISLTDSNVNVNDAMRKTQELLQRKTFEKFKKMK